MSCEYVRDYYQVPATIGRRVRVYGKEGVIAADRGHYIGVNLDEDKPTRISNYHPIDGVEYLEMGTVRKLTRAQQNYQDFIHADCGMEFSEWMLFRNHKGKAV